MKYRIESILDFEIVEYRLIVVLCGKTGVCQILFHFGPALQASVIEHFQVVGDDERHDAVCEALFEEEEPADAPVAVLKRMYGLEALMQVEQV